MKSIFLILIVSFMTGCHSIGPMRLSTEEAICDIPDTETDYLAKAAQFIDQGEEHRAVPWMMKHVQKNPEQIMIRAYLAELLLRLKRYPEAQLQFERFIAAAQEVEGPAKRHLIHCHTRLMEIGQERKDTYTEHLHRGIGFYLLAKQSKPTELEEKGFTEQLLCKAMMELKEAQDCRKEEVRPSWYLYQVWNQLNQPAAARKALYHAHQTNGLSDLSPSEQRSLYLAWRQETNR